MLKPKVEEDPPRTKQNPARLRLPTILASQSPDKAGPLDPEQLRKINAYWRAANYLSVGQIYLCDNPLASRAAEAGARETTVARALGHDARTELHLRASEPGHQTT